MNSHPNPLRSLDLFCKVVDNYGDIGICWRLARQLAHEHGLAVRLWVFHAQKAIAVLMLMGAAAVLRSLV